MITLENRSCTLCGPAAAKSVKFPPTFKEQDLNQEIFSARRNPDRVHFQMMECEECGMIFSDPACAPSLLEDLYEKGTIKYTSQEEQIYNSYAPVLDRAVTRLGTNKRGRFLEIGGGTGFMLKYAVENGFAEQIEIEPSSDAEKLFSAPSQNARMIRDIFKKGMLPSNSVSLACFFQMLDHIPQPLEFLQSVYDVLEPGGVAVCVTHNTSALSAKLLGERSPIFDIEHTYLYNPTNMSRLFEKAGFTKTETFDVSNNYALRHWFNLAPLPKGIKKVLSPCLESTGLGKLKVKINAGNFGIVAQKALMERKTYEHAPQAVSNHSVL
jgi:hypothetical protein